jgi:hypothetical protein
MIANRRRRVEAQNGGRTFAMSIIPWLRELSGSSRLLCHHILKPTLALYSSYRRPCH